MYWVAHQTSHSLSVIGMVENEGIIKTAAGKKQGMISTEAVENT
jgi:hypothetical protein